MTKASIKKKRDRSINCLQNFLNECDRRFEREVITHEKYGLMWKKSNTAPAVCIRGLLKKLKHSFYPHYRYKRRRACSSSTSIGTLIDDQLTLYMQNGCTASLHPFSRQIIECLEENGMVLLATQVPLLDTNSLTFTFIDAVGVEKYTGKSFLLDFKTGYDVGWTRGQHAMNIITTVRDSPKNQHMLQIGWELAIAEAAHAMSFDTAYIMLANRKQACCKRVPISSWAKTHRHCIVNGIVNKKGKH